MTLDLPAATTLSRRAMALTVATALAVSASYALLGVGEPLPPTVAALVLLSLSLPLAVQLLLVRRTLRGARAFASELGGSPSVAVDGNRCELAWPAWNLRLVATTSTARDRRLYAVLDGGPRPISPRGARGAAREVRRDLAGPAPDADSSTSTVPHPDADAAGPSSDTIDAEWNGRLSSAYDARIVGLVVAASAAAASVNVPYGGPLVGLAAFALLATGGVASHALGERRIRRVAAALVAEWADEGGRVEAVTRSASGTEWIVHTPQGRVAVGGLALAPLSTVVIDWDGIDDSLPAADAERRLESLAAEWYATIFA